jgi:ABC-type transport system involved in multi-copper enzyme maturation permease subunit
MILPVALREIRLAAHRPRTFRIRAFSPLILLSVSAALICFLPLTGKPSFTGPELFSVLFRIAYGFCLVTGLAATVDCISEEKREGTLGLLFLTRVKAFDIILGKVTSAALVTGAMLVASLPNLALPVLLGGITLAQVAEGIMMLAATLVFSLSLGAFISTVANDSLQRLMLMAFILPFYGFVARSPSIVTSLSILLFAAATWALPCIWQRSQNFKKIGLPIRPALRKKLLGKNPIFWLGTRAWFGSVGFLVALALAVSLVPVAQRYNWGLAPNPLVPYAITGIAWFGLVVLLQLFMLLLIAAKSCQWISETRQAGLLDLLAGTPLRPSEIFRGHWLSLLHHSVAPLLTTIVALGILLVWFRDIWIFDGGRPMDLTSMLEESLVALFRGSIETGNKTLQYFLVGCVVLPTSWMAIGWTGIWAALRTQKRTQAPILTLLIVIAPPTIIFAPLRGLLEILGVNHVISIRPGYELALWTALTLTWQLGLCLAARWTLQKNFSRLAHGLPPSDPPLALEKSDKRSVLGRTGQGRGETMDRAVDSFLSRFFAERFEIKMASPDSSPGAFPLTRSHASISWRASQFLGLQHENGKPLLTDGLRHVEFDIAYAVARGV